MVVHIAPPFFILLVTLNTNLSASTVARLYMYFEVKLLNSVNNTAEFIPTSRYYMSNLARYAQ
jgi:hypothetical protein